MRSPHPPFRHRPPSNLGGMTLFTALAIAGGVWLHATPSQACLPPNTETTAQSWGIRSPLALVLTLPGVALAGGLAWAGRLYGCDR